MADGLAEPARAKLLDGMNRYTRAVIAIEWPAQAEGHVVRAGDRYLDELQRLAVSLRPSGHELAHAALAIPDMAARRTGTTFGCGDHDPWDRLVCSDRWRSDHNRLQLVPGRAKRTDAPQHVLHAGALWRASACFDYRAEQSVSR